MKLNLWLDRFRSHREATDSADQKQTFQSRAPRFLLDVPITFSVNRREHHGECVNVSETGLLAKFADAPEVWTDGVISLETGDYFLSVQARVARQNGRDVAFAFFIRTENDIAAIRILIDSVLMFPVPDSPGRE